MEKNTVCIDLSLYDQLKSKIVNLEQYRDAKKKEYNEEIKALKEFILGDNILYAKVKEYAEAGIEEKDIKRKQLADAYINYSKIEELIGPYKMRDWLFEEIEKEKTRQEESGGEQC